MTARPDGAEGPAIEVRDLVFEYPTLRALDRVSFTVERGSVVALVGPNGAGKTTLLACIAALRRPFSGEVEVDGVDALREPRECHRRLGYLCDFFGLYDELSVRRCLVHAAATRQVAPDRIAAAIADVAARLSMEDYLDKPAGALSRGQRQRVGIAQAIIHRPRVLLLDEPASGLDPEARHGLAALMLALRDEGMTLMVSSHILAELEDYSSEMLILSGGRIVERRVLGGGVGEWMRVRLAGSDAGLRALLDRPGVSEVTLGSGGARFRLEGGDEERHALLRALLGAGLPVCAFGPDEMSMQDAYLARLAAERGGGDG